MQITVGQLGRNIFHQQEIYIRGIESGLGVHDRIEIPEQFLLFPSQPLPEVRTDAVPLLKEYAEIFLTHKKEITRSGTYNLYVGYLRNGLLPLFGDMPLNCISESRIQDFVNLCVRKGWKISYIRAHVTLLKSIFRSAERDGILKAPSLQIAFPKQAVPELTVLTEEESERLNAYLLHDRKTISAALLIALHTGIRVGEMCALRWSDVDFRRKCIHIQRSVKNYYLQSERRTVREIGETKTLKSNRLIYLTDDFTAVLKERQGCGFIYTGTENFIDTCSARQALNRRLDKLDIPHIRFHALRHGLATRMIRRGVDPKTVAAILGHEHCDMTLDIYTSCTAEMQKDAMNKIEKK